MFVENVGQWDDGARFQVRGAGGGTVWLAEDAIWLTILEPAKRDGHALPFDSKRFELHSVDEPREGANIKLSFVGANPNPLLQPFDPLDTTVSYFLGNDSDQWRPAVPVWGGVRYVDIYPGIDLELTSEGRRMVQRLAVRAGADLGAVRLRVEGAESVALDSEALRLRTAVGEVAWPLLRMEGVGGKITVQPRGALAFDVTVPFTRAHSKEKSVIVQERSLDDNSTDLLFGTFLGGSSDDSQSSVAVDASGAAYVTGFSASFDFPTTPGAFDTILNGYFDAFVLKLNTAGTGLAYATFLGGTNSDYGGAITVDADGAAYVTGNTFSSDFPTTAGAFDISINGNQDAFVVKLSVTGSALAYASFLGGGGDENGRGIAVDSDGAAYVTGETLSSDFPTTAGAFDTSYNGNGDAFVVKLNATGSGLIYATYLGGGSSTDRGLAIVVDSDGAAYVTGNTFSSDFPTTTGAFDTTQNGLWDVFALKLNVVGSGLVYATFLGGSGSDYGSAITVDRNHAAYITGMTGSDFPTTPSAFDTSYNGGADAFAVKLNTLGSELVYATYLGGSDEDNGESVAVELSGEAYVTGYTYSSGFPTTPSAFDTSYNGGADAFVVKLNTVGSGLVYATFLGAGMWDSGWGIAVAESEDAYITGSTDSSDFPTSSGAFDTTLNGNTDAFVVKLAMGEAGPYSISGHVEDADSLPIPDVTVTAGGYSAITDADGNYTITGVPAGTYTLTPSKLGYTFEPATRTVTVPPDATGQGFTGSVSSIPGLPPIVFVHGWLGLPGGDCGLPQPNAYFERLDDDLRDGGYHVEYAFLESSPCYTPPLVENVGELKQAIESAKAATGQDQVILIAHSMGGLVSRAYIEGPDYGQDVQSLFTLGSPHLGVPVEWLAFVAPKSLAAWCATSQPVACEFSRFGIWIFNRQHPDRAPGVIYHAISGDAPLYPRAPLAAAAYYLLPYGDDGAVETSSGTGLSGWVDRWITDEVHGSGSGPRNYFIRDGGQSVSYNYCLKPVLVDKTTDTCGTFGDLRSSAELATTFVQRTPFEYGVLLPGQSRTHHVSLEGGETLFASRWQTGTLGLTLLDPVGQVIDPQYAVDHPDIVIYEADDLMATYHFPDAVAGSWNMVLDAASVPAEGSAFTSFAAFDSPLALTAGTDREWYAPDATALITAALSGSPASAIVTATLSYADGLTDTAGLLPLGGEVYGTHLTIPDVPGYVDLRVAATGTTATGAAFERGLAMAFQISPASADLTDDYTDTPVPRSPGSAFYEALTVTVGVESNITGRLGLSADLIDDQGNLVAHAYSSEEVAPGLHTLELLFDGDDIHASRHDGPYTLTHLLLTDQTGMTLAVLEADNVYVSAAYDYRSFSREQVYLPLVLRGFSGVE